MEARDGVRIGDDLKDLHPPAALRADRHVDGEDPREEVCPADAAWRRVNLGSRWRRVGEATPRRVIYVPRKLVNVVL